MSKMNLKRLARQKFGPWDKRVVTEEQRRGFCTDQRVQWDPECFLNNRYSVQISYVETEAFGTVTHLWIRKHLNEPLRSWQDLMRIKNEIVGEDRVAIEVFPQNDRVVDNAHMTHLWVFGPGTGLPFGLNEDESK